MGNDGLDPIADPERVPGRSPVLETLALLLVALVALGGFVWWTGREPRDRSEKTRAPRSRTIGFAGDKVCADCHPTETALFAHAGHSQTLHAASDSALAEKLSGRTVHDPEIPGVEWSFSYRDRTLTIERRTGPEIEKFIVDYVFGSGHHAATFLTLDSSNPLKPTGFEHRLTYYKLTDEFGITPGQKAGEREGETTDRGRTYPSESLVRCFGCHSSTISMNSSKRIDPATMVPSLVCERCHNMGQAHVDAARRGDTQRLAMEFGPGRYTAVEQMRLCGRCHRFPGELPGLGVLVHPSHIRPGNRDIVRFQPIGLMQSACYARSDGHLTCTTCHNPHARTSNDTAGYEAVCISCHQNAGQSQCPISTSQGCVGCHMPRDDAGQGILFADHWIRIPSRDAARQHETETSKISTESSQ